MTTAETSVREMRREKDWAPDEPGELVGLLLAADDDQWVPATVFGAALGQATDEGLAESIVREHGLSSLADRWRVRLGADAWRVRLGGLREHSPRAAPEVVVRGADAESQRSPARYRRCCAVRVCRRTGWRH